MRIVDLPHSKVAFTGGPLYQVVVCVEDVDIEGKGHHDGAVELAV